MKYRTEKRAPAVSVLVPVVTGLRKVVEAAMGHSAAQRLHPADLS